MNTYLNAIYVAIWNQSDFQLFSWGNVLSSARGNADCLIHSSSCTPPSSHFPKYILYTLICFEERMLEYMLDINHSESKT